MRPWATPDWNFYLMWNTWYPYNNWYMRSCNYFSNSPSFNPHIMESHVIYHVRCKLRYNCSALIFNSNYIKIYSQSLMQSSVLHSTFILVYIAPCKLIIMKLPTSSYWMRTPVNYPTLINPWLSKSIIYYIAG